MPAKGSNGIDGRRKAATLLVALGPERSSEILRHFSQGEVEALVGEILTIGALSEDAANHVIEEFYQEAVANDFVGSGGSDYAEALLTKALGEDKGHATLSRVVELTRPRPFEFLRHADPLHLTTFLTGEHPQTIALVLGHLPHALVASVLKALPREVGAEVAWRLTVMDRTSPEVVDAVESLMQHRMADFLTTDYTRVGGAKFTAKVLGQTDRATEKAILDALGQRDVDLAAEVRRLLFTFDDLILLDDRSMQRVLRDVDLKDLPLALKNAPSELQDLILRNVSMRSADMLREEMSMLGLVRQRQVLEAQQRIVAVVRRLEEQDEIVIERGGGDADV
ncbi:MAG TPA: flagellar motor switch protein FliG [Chloroflexota bacterium]|nr:flagellar motor switch protein FliG [Chloroflexota bacterium]